MKILIFTEGTILMHASLKGLTREQRVKKSKNRVRPFPSDFFENEIPNSNAVQKLQTWKNQGVGVFYLTSRTTLKQIGDIRNVLKKYNFPDSHNLFFRQKKEEYKDVAERLMPDILIEDYCESIDGKAAMTYPHIKPELKAKIKSITVKEFRGIDHLPDDINELKRYNQEEK